MSQGSTGTMERWTANRWEALLVKILKGDTAVSEAARRQWLTVAEIEEWQAHLPLAGENALRGQPTDDEALKDEQS